MRNSATASSSDHPAGPALDPLLCPIEFSSIAAWPSDEHAAALACFRVSARRVADHPGATARLGVDAEALALIGQLALRPEWNQPGAARQFFERFFLPHRVETDNGFVTGYYEPEIAASPVRTDRFAYPLYRRPPDLIEIAETAPPQARDNSRRFARHTPDGPVPYFDRAEIEAGVLAGQSLELAWIEDPVDGFFIHVQGSARLSMPDGSAMRLSYAGKNGHPYTSIGRLLVDAGELDAAQASMQTVRDWLAADPDRARSLMNRNRSFIFFEENRNADPASGPVGAAEVALTEGRSLAVDQSLHTYGAPIWVATRTALPERTRPWRRLMIAQDTGSAITGPARGDLFMGSGDEAGRIAGAIRHEAVFIVLVPNRGSL